MTETIFNVLAALAGAAAAGLWWRASVVSVPAPAGTLGVGAPPGGYLIGLVNGQRVDLHATLALQAKWNARAARAATLAAAFTACAVTAKILGAP